MVDVNLLKTRMDESGLKKGFIAQQLGVTPQGLYKKLTDKSDWYYTQVMVLKDLLKLSDEDVSEIFFAENVDLQSTQ